MTEHEHLIENIIELAKDDKEKKESLKEIIKKIQKYKIKNIFNDGNDKALGRLKKFVNEE